MVQKNGSDLFITADVPPSMKVNGTIMPVTKSPLNAEQSMALVKSIMTPAQVKEFEETNECQFAITDKNQTARFRAIFTTYFKRHCHEKARHCAIGGRNRDR